MYDRLRVLAETDPVEAVKYSLAIPKSWIRNHSIRTVALVFARTDRAAARELAEKIDDPYARNEAIERIAETEQEPGQ